VVAGGVSPVVKLTLFPKETRFFAFFEQQAENIVHMAQQLQDMINSPQNLKERASIIADMEGDGDAITHDIMKLLYRSFITPLDREDISSLANSLDNIADMIHIVADTFYLYKIEKSTDKAKELSDIILKAVMEVEGSVTEIKSTVNQPELLKRCVAINQIENSSDAVYHAALAELFAQPHDMILVVKWREIYKHMKSTLVGCEHFADVLESIAVKYA
jgi:uncharacterized protein